MNKLYQTFLVLLVIGCAAKESPEITGKWYTYAESGDYMELWLGEDKAMSYLSGIDQFLLYDLKRDGKTLDFSLIESRVVDEHNFKLQVNKSSEELFQATFIGDNKVDSLKTYFLINRKTPDIKGSLAENQELMNEMFERLESGSHAGHGH
ncbi:hypothetical protein SAMN05421640_2400 [Ekhidna lutea]|uniref:Uncharacterized protein n=1 Tax=Ekhidna lutea TaxID=447679 RepID=A0A239K511_EKHLU|nr:hypothetical protein [Ekhidna lutea]SNT12733.1 hypothetical protein SAMN05421640_2400 [Ekhidna lutea]